MVRGEFYILFRSFNILFIIISSINSDMWYEGIEAASPPLLLPPKIQLGWPEDAFRKGSKGGLETAVVSITSSGWKYRFEEPVYVPLTPQSHSAIPPGRFLPLRVAFEVP